MNIHHIPSKVLHDNYPVVIRYSTLISMILITSFLFFIPRDHINRIQLESIANIEIEQIDIPLTQQIDLPPPPARPTVPIESESEDLSEDLTIDETTFDSYNPLTMNPPPPPSSGPNVKFIAYDSPPEPIGGYAAIKNNIKYPDLAREAGVDGTVIVYVFVDIKGRVKNMEILVGVPNTGLNEAAMDAIRKTRFKPAYQRDKPVAVWVSIPIKFILDS